MSISSFLVICIYLRPCFEVRADLSLGFDPTLSHLRPDQIITVPHTEYV